MSFVLYVFFRELRMMLYSLLGSVVSLLWAVAVFMLIFFIFGMVFTLGVFDYCIKGEQWNAENTETLRAWFGTLDRSTLSLFMGISGGKDWGDYYEVIQILPFVNRALYLLYIWFCVIAAMNVITGVFVENAMCTSELDRDFLIQEEIHEKDKYVKAMRGLFAEMDVSNSGGISLVEFETHLEDPRAIAYFNAMEVDFSEAKTLFVLLDVDNSGTIDFEEFLEGCEKLKGEAKSIDLAMLHYEVRWLSRVLLEVQETSTSPMPRHMMPHMSAAPAVEAAPETSTN